MATLTKTETGTAIASPKPEAITWINEDEAEKLAKAIGRQYVRKGKVDEAKLFFYKIQGMHPYQPGGIVASEEQCRYQYEIQKYHRNKTEKKNRLDESGHPAGEYEANLRVESHELKRLPGGRDTWVLKDGDASFFIDTEDFKKQFEIDVAD